MYGVLKRASNPPELETQVVVNLAKWVPAIEGKSSERALCACHHWAISPAPSTTSVKWNFLEWPLRSPLFPNCNCVSWWHHICIKNSPQFSNKSWIAIDLSYKRGRCTECKFACIYSLRLWLHMWLAAQVPATMVSQLGQTNHWNCKLKQTLSPLICFCHVFY